MNPLETFEKYLQDRIALIDKANEANLQAKLEATAALDKAAAEADKVYADTITKIEEESKRLQDASDKYLAEKEKKDKEAAEAATKAKKKAKA